MVEEVVAVINKYMENPHLTLSLLTMYKMYPGLVFSRTVFGGIH